VGPVVSDCFVVTTVGLIAVWGGLLIIGYVYAGYPILLWIITRWRRRGVIQRDITPPVTLVISAFNEEQIIGKKILNALKLDYPSDQLEILVVSDASSDATEAIVRSFAERGVKLIRMLERRGKTAGLNVAVQEARGEIIVFSDANIIYKREVIRKLVRNFADPRVGCVTGNSCYLENSLSPAHVQENTYWQYEQTIRMLESQLGSTVGGDGAIFAIRKDLYAPLAPDTINDLVVPLQIVARGYRAVFEPEAVGFEPSAGYFVAEFRRKRRIVNRSWRGLRSVPEVLDPRAVGIFAWQVLSHKVLRWLILPIVLTVAAGCFVAFPVGFVYQVGALGFVASLGIAVIGGLTGTHVGQLTRLTHGLFYFYMVNLAAFLGLVMAVFGRVEVVWMPERR
jgi:cellulose synthase/poly-beta-1,6-N-acetylglucosamine synthase-like glycosyltransferase